jgi:hypothetical protein
MKSFLSKARHVSIPTTAAGMKSHFQFAPDLTHAEAMAAQRIAEREEMPRLFQRSGLVHADELPDGSFWIDDVDQAQMSRSLKLRHEKPVLFVVIPFERPLQHLNLVRSSSPVARVSDCTSPPNSRQFSCT